MVVGIQSNIITTQHHPLQQYQPQQQQKPLKYSSTRSNISHSRNIQSNSTVRTVADECPPKTDKDTLRLLTSTPSGRSTFRPPPPLMAVNPSAPGYVLWFQGKRGEEVRGWGRRGDRRWEMHDERQDKHNVNVTQQTGDGKWKMGDWHRVITVTL